MTESTFTEYKRMVEFAISLMDKRPEEIFIAYEGGRQAGGTWHHGFIDSDYGAHIRKEIIKGVDGEFEEFSYDSHSRLLYKVMDEMLRSDGTPIHVQGKIRQHGDLLIVEFEPDAERPGGAWDFGDQEIYEAWMTHSGSLHKNTGARYLLQGNSSVLDLQSSDRRHLVLHGTEEG
jgi:hypothetical protein